MWLAERLVDAATGLYELADKIDPGPMGEPCPDCGVPTTVPPDKPCPECKMRAEDERRDDHIYGAGFEDGHVAGTRDMAERHGL